MIDTQLLNDALIAIVIAVGLAIALSVFIVLVGTLAQRIQRRRHIRDIEQHLASVAEHESASAR